MMGSRAFVNVKYRASFLQWIMPNYSRFDFSLSHMCWLHKSNDDVNLALYVICTGKMASLFAWFTVARFEREREVLEHIRYKFTRFAVGRRFEILAGEYPARYQHGHLEWFSKNMPPL